MNYTVLKIKDWLKKKEKPDWNSFSEHVKIWGIENIAHSLHDLIILAKAYNITPQMFNKKFIE